MGFLSGLFGGGAAAAGSAVKDTLQGVGSLATDIRSAITGQITPQQQSALQQKTLDLQQAVETAQAQINAAEAKSSSTFVAGWRPFIGWICGVAFAVNFIVFPLLQWGLNIAQKGITLPVLNISEMMPVLLGMLGLGTMRTIEKNQGSQGNH